MNMNWKEYDNNENVTEEANSLFEFFSQKFKETHDGNEYESSYKDPHILEQMQKRRGLIETYILIEGYFQTDITRSKWRFNQKHSRCISFFRLSVNEMLFDKKIQAALKMKGLAKQKLIKQGLLPNETIVGTG